MRRCEYIVGICSILTFIYLPYAYSSCVLSSDASINNKCNTSLLPSTDECGLSTEDVILNGDETELGEFPWMAILKLRHKYEKTEDFECGGVLIHQRYVVTAAHCVSGKNIPRIKEVVSVRLGEHNLVTPQDCVEFFGGAKSCADEPVDIPIEEILVHSGYNASSRYSKFNDIALLRLAKIVNFTDFVKPICLPITPEYLNNTFEGQSHYVAGFGLTEKEVRSNVKLKLSVPIRSNKECRKAYENRTEIHKGHLCAGGEKAHDTCKGDSGGPLMKQLSANWYCTGIVSFGPQECGTPGKPGVYVRMTEYVSWILDHIRP